MKISLNLKQNDVYVPDDVERERAIERALQDCRQGDWEGKARLFHFFMPLLTTLAHKRTEDTAAFNRLIDAGKEGILTAMRHSKTNRTVKFEVFALAYIESAMDRANRRGFLARVFGLNPPASGRT